MEEEIFDAKELYAMEHTLKGRLTSDKESVIHHRMESQAVLSGDGRVLTY